MSWDPALNDSAVLYRREESARYRADGFEDRMRARLAADPELNREVRAAWSEVERDILDRFRAMVPKTKADRDKGPKIFEVHHEIAVGKECLLLRLDETGSADDAAEYTRRRLGLIGDPAAFYALSGADIRISEVLPIKNPFLQIPFEPGPEPV